MRRIVLLLNVSLLLIFLLLMSCSSVFKRPQAECLRPVLATTYIPICISCCHNNRTSLPPSLIHSSLMLLSLRNGMSAKRISLNHDTSPYTLYCWLSGYEIHDIEIPDYAFPVFSRQQGRLPVTVHVQFHVPFQCLVTAQAGYVPCRSPPAVPVSGGHGTVPVPKGGPWS